MSGLRVELFRGSEAALFFQEGFNFSRHRLGHEPQYRRRSLHVVHVVHTSGSAYSGIGGGITGG